MPRKAATATATEGEDTQTRRSSRLAAQPRKEEAAPPKRQPAKKRSADAEGNEPEEHVPVAKKSRGGKKAAEPKADGDAEAPAEGESAPGLSPIDIGDILPSVTLKNEKGEDVDVSTLTAEKGLVLFLVPKADTPGCTNQACGFRDIYPDFTSLNFEVYCLSADSPTAQTKWQTKKNLPYPLLSDPKRTLISALGAGEGGKTKRSHFIFEKGGKLVDKKIPVKPVDSPKLALEFIQSLSS